MNRDDRNILHTTTRTSSTRMCWLFREASRIGILRVSFELLLQSMTVTIGRTVVGACSSMLEDPGCKPGAGLASDAPLCLYCVAMSWEPKSLTGSRAAAGAQEILPKTEESDCEKTACPNCVARCCDLESFKHP